MGAFSSHSVDKSFRKNQEFINEMQKLKVRLHFEL